MNAGQLCIREVVVARGDEPLMEAAQLMRRFHVGNVVVIERRGDANVPIGILTDRDIVVAVVARSADKLADLTVADVATAEVTVVDERTDLSQVIATMKAHGVRRMPVVDGDGGLVGIVTLDDVLELLAQHLADLSSLVVREQDHERAARP